MLARTLLIGAAGAILLAGCSSSPESSANSGDNLPTASTTDTTLPLRVDADCSSPQVVSVAVREGQVVATPTTVTLKRGESLRVVVQSDESALLAMGGTGLLVRVEKGASSACALYSEKGEFRVQIGDRVASTVTVG